MFAILEIYMICVIYHVAKEEMVGACKMKSMVTASAEQAVFLSLSGFHSRQSEKNHVAQSVFWPVSASVSGKRIKGKTSFVLSTTGWEVPGGFDFCNAPTLGIRLHFTVMTI